MHSHKGFNFIIVTLVKSYFAATWGVGLRSADENKNQQNLNLIILIVLFLKLNEFSAAGATLRRFAEGCARPRGPGRFPGWLLRRRSAAASPRPAAGGGLRICGGLPPAAETGAVPGWAAAHRRRIRGPPPAGERPGAAAAERSDGRALL